MARRQVGHVGMILLGLLPCLGCVTTSGGLPVPGTGPAAAPAAAEHADLPAAQAAQLCLELARSLEQAGHTAEAAGQYELARHYNPQLDVGRRLAVLYSQLGNSAQAQTEFQRALDAHPKDADLLNDLGYHYYNCGQWADAELYLRKALAINPTHPSAWTNLGMTLAQEGHYAESLQAFQRCVSAAEAQCNLGFILTAQGKREEAKQAYQEALRLKPGLRLARAALAKLESAEQPPAASAAKEQAQPGVISYDGQPLVAPAPLPPDADPAQPVDPAAPTPAASGPGHP